MFDLDAVLDEEAKTPYTFKAGGREWRLPHVHDLTLGQQFDVDRGRIVQVVAEVAEVRDGKSWTGAGRELADLLLTYKAARVGQLQAAWLTQAGLESGN